MAPAQFGFDLFGAVPADAPQTLLPPLAVLGTYLFALVAAYAGFGLGEREARARGAHGWLWRAAAALLLAMGACSAVWLGLSQLRPSPLPSSSGALLALLPSFAASLCALALVSGEIGQRLGRRIVAAALLALAILAAHLLSLAAAGPGLRIAHHLPSLLLAVPIAIAGAALALQLAGFGRPRRAHAPASQALAGAMVFAAAVTGSHVAALAAARIEADPAAALAQRVHDWHEPVLPLIALVLAVAAVMVRLFERRDGRRLFEYRARLRREQRIDAATGLPVAHVLGESFLRMQRQAVLQRAGVAVAVIKLAGLERVLASHGAEERDQLYSLAAWRLRTARHDDELLGALGDERFVMVLRVADAAEATQRVREVLSMFDSALREEQLEIRVRPHAGISLWPTQGEHFERLLSNALVALDRSRPGLVQVYLAAHREESERRNQVESELAAALAGDELSAVFQPVIGAVSGRVETVEMLARWHSPVLGDVHPGQFVLVAEASGMIGQFDRWLFRHAMATLKWLDAAGFPQLQVAVNVSPLNLTDPGFAAFVESLVAKGGVDASRIEVEITEAALADGDRAVFDTLLRLRQLGMRLAIDDFGIGHSSLSRLRDLPVDRLKIDQSFVRDIDHRQGEQLVAGIIALAHGLGLAVTAEGVETETQRVVLAELGVESLQGFLIGRPMSWRALLDFLGEPSSAAAGPFASSSAA